MTIITAEGCFVVPTNLVAPTYKRLMELSTEQSESGKRSHFFRITYRVVEAFQFELKCCDDPECEVALQIENLAVNLIRQMGSYMLVHTLPITVKDFPAVQHMARLMDEGWSFADAQYLVFERLSTFDLAAKFLARV